MTDLTAMLAARQAMIDEMAAEIAPAGLQPDEFTAADVVERTGGTRGMVREHLRNAVAAGRLSCRFVTIGGKTCKAYRALK